MVVVDPVVDSTDSVVSVVSVVGSVAWAGPGPAPAMMRAWASHVAQRVSSDEAERPVGDLIGGTGCAGGAREHLVSALGAVHRWSNGHEDPGVEGHPPAHTSRRRFRGLPWRHS